MPTVIDRTIAEPAAFANQTRRPDDILAAADDAGVHGKTGKPAECPDSLFSHLGEHSRPQRSAGFVPIGDDTVLTMTR